MTDADYWVRRLRAKHARVLTPEPRDDSTEDSDPQLTGQPAPHLTRPGQEKRRKGEPEAPE